MVLDPIPQSLPVHFFGSRPQPPTSRIFHLSSFSSSGLFYGSLLYVSFRILWVSFDMCCVLTGGRILDAAREIVGLFCRSLFVYCGSIFVCLFSYIVGLI